jgi:anion-transporting  ArsA/GET3 family ATPase
VRAADRGRQVVVMTIDPARRLAQALGLDSLSNTPAARHSDGTQRLHALMLDMRRTFDELVEQNSAPNRGMQILNNRCYQTVASSFSGTQEYMAMDKVGQLIARPAMGSGR